jgi:hypothetical protein
LDLLTYSIYIFVSLTRLFLNLYTAHSDVGGTMLYFSLARRYRGGTNNKIFGKNYVKLYF